MSRRWYSIQVKQKDKAGRPDIDAFEAMMAREECAKGFFMSFDYTGDAEAEVARFFKQTGHPIGLLTVRQILDEQIALRLVRGTHRCLDSRSKSLDASRVRRLHSAP